MIARQGMTLINKGGEIKEVANHLAYDTQLQKQMNFFPCDENGNPLPQGQAAVVVEPEVKKSPVAEADVRVEIPEGSTIINPLEEEERKNREAEAAGEEIGATPKKKPGRKSTK